MQKTNNLQEIFLTQARRDRRSVTMFLMNGFQMRGYVTGFDAFTVVLTSDGKQQIVYKHAISTIVPERPIPLYEPGRRSEDRLFPAGPLAPFRFVFFPSDTPDCFSGSPASCCPPAGAGKTACTNGAEKQKRNPP